MWKIYKHTLKDCFEHSGWSYIGQTNANDMRERFGSNGCRYKACPVFWNAICKYGWDAFSHELIEDNLTIEQANEREQYWIAYYHTWVDDPNCAGYNMDKGGNNHCQSLQQKEYLSALNKGRPNIKNKIYKYIYKDDECKKVMPDEIQKYLDSGWTAGNGQLGKTRDTHKHPSNDQAVICIETQEIFKNIRTASLYYKCDVGPCVRGEYWRTAGGYHWSKITDLARINSLSIYIGCKRIFSAADGKPCMCIETGKKYKNISIAEKATGIKTIKYCCAGKNKTAGKLHWVYISREELLD